MNANHASGAPGNPWLEAQNLWIDSWRQMMDAAASPAAATANPFLPGMMGQWQEAVQRSLGGMNDYTASTAQAVSRQMLVAQEQMLRMMQMATDAWKRLAASGNGPANWQADLNDIAEQMRQQMMDSYVASMQGGGEAAQLYQAYLAEMATLAAPWQAAMTQMPAWRPGAEGWSAGVAGAMDANLKAFDQSFGRFLTSPTLGLYRNSIGQVNQGFKLWLEARTLEVEYQTVVSGAWSKAFQAMMTKLVALVQEGKPVQSVRELTDIWVEVADKEFFALFHSDEFAALQGRYLNSSMALKRAQRDLLENWLRANDLPTRSDLDEAYHEIYTLRKEVKALKKTLNQMSGGPRVATPADEVAETAPVKKPRAAKKSTKAVDTVEKKPVEEKPSKSKRKAGKGEKEKK